MYNTLDFNAYEYPLYNNFYRYNNRLSSLELNNLIRKLWEDHVFWTRLVIMSIANNSPDTQIVSNRLLRNATDFGNAFLPFYGSVIAQQFTQLMHDHLTIAADLVMAAKRKDNDAVNSIEKKWYQNADAIAIFLSQINPYWNIEEIRKMLYNHLALTKNEAVAILNNDYQQSIALFDEIENQALMMADIFTEGLINQFPDKII